MSVIVDNTFIDTNTDIKYTGKSICKYCKKKSDCTFYVIDDSKTRQVCDKGHSSLLSIQKIGSNETHRNTYSMRLFCPYTHEVRRFRGCKKMRGGHLMVNIEKDGDGAKKIFNYVFVLGLEFSHQQPRILKKRE